MPHDPIAANWVKSLEDPKMWDQTAFNNLARLVRLLYGGLGGQADGRQQGHRAFKGRPMGAG